MVSRRYSKRRFSTKRRRLSSAERSAVTSLIKLQDKLECSKCHKIKNLSEFYEHKKKLSGRHNYCRSCFSKL